MLAAASHLSIALLQASALAADPAVFFEERVRPLLASRCFGCHGDTAVSRLRLDSREGMLKGGRRGPALAPSDSAASLLIRAVERAGELKMPPEGRLSDGEIGALRSWVQAGAPWPAARQVLAAPTGKITAEQRNWWAFRPLAPHAAQGTVDRFITAKMAENSVTPMPPADRRTLIRRLAFDLTGLPPTPEEAAAFMADGNTAAAIDRLLASPRFGERWGRYWLDIARYGEDDFRGLDQEKYPNAWRYRDWVIEAVNRDLPYPTFVKAQLAADLVESDGAFDLRPALGYLGLGPWHYAISPPPQARADERHDRIDAVTRGFLGLTVACARCHDHKFDPITMRDYYGLAGVFASTAYREFPLTAQDVVDRYEAHQQKIKAAEKNLADFLRQQKAQLGDMLAAQSARYIAAVRAGTGSATGLNQQVLERWKLLLNKPAREHTLLDSWREGDDAPARLQETIASVIAEKKEIDEEKRLALERSKPTRGAKTRLPNGFETYDDFCPGCDVSVRAQPRERFKLWEDLYRDAPKDKPAAGGVLAFSDAEIEPLLSGEWKRHLEFLRAELAGLKQSAPVAYPFLHAAGDKPEPGNLKLALKGDPYRLGEETPRRFLEVLSPARLEAWTNGSGRLQLAEAIIAQPLAARVAVNRVWMKMMGRALVGSPSNFGRYGERPSHPELLEYLAARYINGGWSTKKLIREIALSAAYQRSSESLGANEAIDAANKWYWRANRERLDVEALRDSLLAVAGTLDPQTGGSSEELSPEHRRRTVYGRVSRFKLNETLQLFDFPSPATTSEKRNVTHVPLQRLFFLNGELVARQAAAFAARIESEAGPSAEAQIERAYLLLFQRRPSLEERRLNTGFLATAGWKQLAQVLLSSNEFLFVD